ncbi:Glycosyl hydrolase family 47 protein [Trichomonas vaginalis G3]|uniref:alpha-1,2-Mannosidase n=1 Tax=Trichomonas vaginalis (strain ATCC PRA-98 / G3) TaxID=412133 RepID=A2F055_TRIV3|nr:glycosyl hydrolase [Trichomonas vaginalis G3]EAY01690.1 Glycosyl hydrolase family 47 protein [Trichomonas vaginalis G3]KAI5489625.1 mannosyl-oligosaccharide 1,2-alpha-mannosidase protein [Trichomonas vaginalis G3]|eukprot:XP_001330386.1 glycosyl hydrolase [Trichomonas vaginalis G3]
MNLTTEYIKARDFIQTEFRPNGSWSLFEFIIRFVGGFTSMYELTNDKLYLDKAVMCADAIFPLMSGGIFGGGVSLRTDSTGKITANGGGGGGHNVADSNTYQLEFISLSMLTGDPKYADLAVKTYKHMWGKFRNQGLIPENFHSGSLHVGANIDSYYEYIIKIYVMTRGVANNFLNKHLQIVKDIKEKLVIHSGKNNYTGLGVYSNGRTDPMQEHLGTFAGGMIAVGTVKENPHATEDLKLADELVTGYAKAYEFTQTGVGPEKIRFSRSKDHDFEIENCEYMLRPESSESVYVMWKFTGLPKFRAFAWNMFNGINTYARRSKGFSHISNVDSKNSWGAPGPQESFFLAETLKYLYLTFADTSIISPAQWVFNTEGHPLRIFTEEEAQKWKSVLNF